MKKIISAIVSCVLVMTMGAAASFAAEKQDGPAAAQFSDVAGTPYEKAVVYLTEKGVIDGFEDGTFRPQGIVTRAQACKMIVQMLGAAEDELKAAFPRVKVSARLFRRVDRMIIQHNEDLAFFGIRFINHFEEVDKV